MNERILSPQLLKLVQAAGPGYSLADPKWVKKFAESIVLECAEVSFKHWEKHKGCSAHFSIREHFGVKE